MRLHPVSDVPSDVRQWLVFCQKEAPPQAPVESLQRAAQEAFEQGWFEGELGACLPVMREGQVLMMVGLGEAPERVNHRKLAEMAKKALVTAPLTPKQPVALLPPNQDEATLRALTDGVILGLYQWNRYITRKEDDPDYTQWQVYLQTGQKHLVNRFIAMAEGANHARDLGNANADEATPLSLAEQLRELGEHDDRCHIEILDEKAIQERGLHLHHAVSQGSSKPPRLAIITYRGRWLNDPYVALVGKGITYDTGGLNIKRSEMDEMRMDMCGAAAVIGTLQVAQRLNIACNAYFVCPLAENAIGPDAYKPGDVVSSYAGKTVEIANTDAEGRLVMADANSYMARNYQPQGIINIATLTGACIMALGLDHCGLMSSDDALADALLEAAAQTDDRAWRLPIYSELSDHLKSEIADIKNMGIPRMAGALAAGEFLRQFAQCDDENLPWAHLDIAGAGMLDRNLAYFNQGASGAGVRMLSEYLWNRAQRYERKPGSSSESSS